MLRSVFASDAAVPSRCALLMLNSPPHHALKNAWGEGSREPQPFTQRGGEPKRNALDWECRDLMKQHHFTSYGVQSFATAIADLPVSQR